MKDVTGRLLPDRSKSDEFEVFMGSKSGTAQLDRRRIVREAGRLVIDYDKHHQVESIKVVDDYDESTLRALEAEIADALSEQGKVVEQRYIHSLYATGGFFRHGDVFQILPSPRDAPQPPFLHAPHSLLLEYSFPRSANGLVNAHRSQRRFSELSLLLSALLPTLMVPIGTASHRWAVVTEPEWTSRYVQLGYIGGKDFRPQGSDGFSLVDGLSPLESVDAGLYYTQPGVLSGEPLRLPDTFTKLIDAYERLDEVSKVMFCRASYWSQVSYQVFEVSQSASFAALVSAVEVFLRNADARCETCGRPISSESCSSCKQPIAGPTKQFRDFVEKHVPGIPASDRNKLYNRRSALSHGSTLLPGDLSEIGFRFTPAYGESTHERLLLAAVVQLVLVNWLASHHRDDASCLDGS
jgi:hypothetical protein